MRMSRFLRRKSVRVVAGVYVILWILTATWGNYDVDRHFDQEFQYGYDSSSHTPPKMTRLRRFYVEDLDDPRNTPLMPEDSFFRYRSHGIPVAPFVIVDKIGTVYAALGGIGCRRLNVWFFGYTKWWPIWVYWVC
jgi:hypothetical protein